MIFSILTKALAGAVVGYGTNDLAVQMLFRKRFGLGGIVLKTHEQFIENISQLVEQEIINHHTLSIELENDTFKQALTATTERFFQESLKQAFPEEYLLHYIPHIEESFSAIKQDFIAHLDAPIEALINYVLQQVELKAVLSDTQLRAIAQSLRTSLTHPLPQIGLSDLLLHLHREVKHQLLHYLVPRDVLQTITTNLGTYTEALPPYIQFNYASSIDDFIASSKQTLQLDHLLKSTLSEMADQPLRHWITPAQFAALIEVLKEVTVELLTSSKGQLILQTFGRLLLQILKEEKATVFSLLSEDLEHNFNQFLQERLPQTLERVMAFVKEQKVKIDALIDQTFRDNTRFKLQDWAVKIFAGSVSERARVVTRIVDYVEKYDAKQLANIATSFLIDFLKENTIGQIFEQLDEALFVDNLTALLKDNGTKWLKKRAPDQLDFLLDYTLADLVGAQTLKDQIEKIEAYGIKHLKEDFLYHPRLSHFLHKKIEEQASKLGNTTIETLISNNQLASYAPKLEEGLMHLIQQQKETLDRFIFENLQQTLIERRLGDLIHMEQLGAYTPVLYQHIDKALTERFEQVKQRPVHHYLAQLDDIDQIYPQLAQYLQQATLNNLPILLEGRIEALVKQNLRPLPPERIRDMVEKFMGKEIAPINILGAFLGTITGGLLTALPALPNPYLSTALAGLSYGITGYGTNYLALKMIFRPYEAKYWQGRRLPFTPGIIAKNQRRFAQNMGKFVDQNLLNKANLIEKFEAQKQVIESNLVTFLSKNNYEILDQLNQANLGRTANLVTQKATDYLYAHTEIFAEALSDLIAHQASFDLSQIDTSTIKYKVNQYLSGEDFSFHIQEQVASLTQAWLTTSQPLKDFIPRNTLKHSSKYLTTFIRRAITQWAEQLATEQIVGLLQEQVQPSYDRQIEQPISQLLSQPQRKHLRTKLSDRVKKALVQPDLQKRLVKLVQKRLEKEIHPKRTIGQMLNGQLIQFVEENINKLLEKLLEDGIAWLIRHKKSLADEVYNRAYKENKAVFFYKGVIKKTVIELTEEGLPNFFRSQLPAFERLLEEEVEQLADTPLGQINPQIDPLFLEGRLQNLLHHRTLIESAQKISTITFDYTTSLLPLKKLLLPLEAATISQLADKFDVPLQKTIFQLKQALLEQRFVLAASATPIIHSILLHYLAPTSLQKLLTGIAPSVWSDASRRLLIPILQSTHFQTKQKVFVDAFFAHIKSKPLAESIDVATLQQDVTQIFEQLMAQPDLKVLLSQSIHTFTQQNLQHLNEKLALPTKDFLLEKLANAAFITLEQNIPSLLGAVDLKRVVVSEIEAMPPQEVEKLFNSFASQYFGELIRYGFGFGVVFGLGIDGLLSWLTSKL